MRLRAERGREQEAADRPADGCECDDELGQGDRVRELDGRQVEVCHHEGDQAGFQRGVEHDAVDCGAEEGSRECDLEAVDDVAVWDG